MAISSIYRLHSVVLEYADPTPDIVLQVTQGSAVNEIEVIRERNSGSQYPTYSRSHHRSGTINFTTQNLDLVLAAIGSAGLCFASDAGSPNLIAVHLYYGNFDCDSLAAGGHIVYSIQNGVIVPRILSCSQGEDAQVTVEVMGIAANSLPVITKAASGTVPTLTLANYQQRWTLGTHDFLKVDVQTVAAINQKTSVEVDFGVDVESLGADGEDSNSWTAINSVMPVVTIRGLDPNWVDNTGVPNIVPVDGGLADLESAANDGSQVAFMARDQLDSAAKHVLCRFSGTAYSPSMADGSDANSPVNTEVRVDCSQGDGSAPLILEVNKVMT